MEQLTKQQIILLCLLVSFVSSIATGIVTVSLMDQAPPAVTQTINHVVERTIEKATPASTSSTIKETVIIHDDQAVANAIAKITKTLVHISSGGNPVALGVLVSENGLVVARTDEPYAGILRAELDGGNTVALKFVSRDETTGITVLQAEQGSDPQDVRVYTKAVFADASAFKLGQSVVEVGGVQDRSVATGVISALPNDAVKTDARDGDIGFQAVLSNLSGEIIGIKDQNGGFISSNILKTYATP